MGAGSKILPERKWPAMQRVVEDFLYGSSWKLPNLQFAEFIQATAMSTMAQRVPNADDYPDIPAELLVPGLCVFV